MKEEPYVYEMPEHFGGGWAFANSGIIMDGFLSERQAYQKALEIIKEFGGNDETPNN